MSKGKSRSGKSARMAPKFLELANDSKNPNSVAWKNTVYNDEYRKSILEAPSGPNAYDPSRGNILKQMSERNSAMFIQQISDRVRPPKPVFNPVNIPFQVYQRPTSPVPFTPATSKTTGGQGADSLLSENNTNVLGL